MFLVVFRNRKRPDMDAAAYSADAARMEELAQAQPRSKAMSPKMAK
jgi:hypothetical protein